MVSSIRNRLPRNILLPQYDVAVSQQNYSGALQNDILGSRCGLLAVFFRRAVDFAFGSHQMLCLTAKNARATSETNKNRWVTKHHTFVIDTIELVRIFQLT